MKHHTASGHISCLPDPGIRVAERPQVPVTMREGEGSASAWDHESSVLNARPAFLCLLRMSKVRGAAAVVLHRFAEVGSEQVRL